MAVQEPDDGWYKVTGGRVEHYLVNDGRPYHKKSLCGKVAVIVAGFHNLFKHDTDGPACAACSRALDSLIGGP